MKLTRCRFYLATTAIVVSLLGAGAATARAADGWVPLFDGTSLKNWEQVGGEGQSKWSVKAGAICGEGGASMLVCTKGPYTNFRFRAEVKINDGGNSGMYFRCPRGPGKPSFSDGYEAQIDSTHRDPIRTGSLYGLCHIYRDLVAPDEWFNYEIEAVNDNWRGKPVTKIKVKVNGEELYEYFDFEQLWKEGYFAFQQHDPGSKVCIRKVEVMPLRDSEEKKK